MKLFNEDQILDEAFRAKVIKEITSQENINRKNESLRRYEIFKDRIKKWVVESLQKEGLKEDTLLLMESRASNISICKKVVKKLARAYVNGVERETQDEQSKNAIEELVRELDFNSKMLKTDQYVQLFKNVLVGVLPELNTEESDDNSSKYDLAVRVMPPHRYDVIEDYANPEKAKVVILTDFVERNRAYSGQTLLSGDGRMEGVVPRFDQGNQVDEIIADHPDDEGRNSRTFIWWSQKYHFTTDDRGRIIPELSPEDGQSNPIEMMPWVTFAEDQDHNYWAQGGDDLIDGSILINKLLTDTYSIAFHQGWGQMVISGKDIPDKLPVGPRKALILPQNSSDDPAPQVYFANSNPPLDAWMSMVEQFTALLLSTNNLSPRTVSGKLDAVDPASGISRLIDQSESTVDIGERQKIFKDNEPIIWEVTRRWVDVLKESSSLSESFDLIGQFKDSTVQLEFNHPQPVITEKEKLENIKARKDLGLDTEIDLIKALNPGMTDDEAEKKLLKIKEQKLENMSRMMNGISQQEDQSQDNQIDDPSAVELPNQVPDDEEVQPNGSVQNQT